MQEDLEDYHDLKELRKAKADPKNQHGRSFDIVAAELGLIKKKDAPLPASSPYIAMTQSSDYNITQFKKRRK